VRLFCWVWQVGTDRKGLTKFGRLGDHPQRWVVESKLGVDLMSDDLKKLIEAARTRTISADELQAQRRSFAYGNTKIENDRVTREMVDAQDEILMREALAR